MSKPNLNNAVIAFDMDGVLNKYKFGVLGIQGLDAPQWVEANMLRNMYNFAEKTSAFDEIIESKNPMDMYVISVALTSFEQTNKLSFLEEHYPAIREEHAIFVGDTKYKVEVLKTLRQILDQTGKANKDLVMIEDDARVLLDITKLDNPRIKCYLVSDFM